MATAKRSRAKAAEATKTARANAPLAAVAANWEAVQAARTAEAKAREAEEAAETAAAKAVEAEQAAETARVMAEEAAKAREAAREMGRLEDQESEWAQCDEELFASRFRRYWNKSYAFRSVRRSRTFLQTTSIPAMRYTYPAPDDSPKAMETLQMVSVKIAAIKEGLRWPLQVFGLVAARDNLDHMRNIIFHRSRKNCQTITEEDPYLALTGPSRAIAVSVDPSCVEVSLKVKGATKAEDKDLSDLVLVHRTGRFLSGLYRSRLSTLELTFDHVTRSVEATICVKLTDGSWPTSFRGVITASSGSRDDLKVKLLDSGDDGLPVDANGRIKLSRHVVSVGHVESLNVYVTANRVDEKQVVESGRATFKAKRSGVSLSELCLGFCSMNVTVAWSCFRHEW
ncbi:uncharacterized protein LOC125518569 [Triticum urartu]|uniref:uncharacterized protein LOC125518569 n=1 Tax=Triticum urartu TaxID=4572 RepID=UPI0020431945|nr:uncharacterized protein LOC125518569 [Triticum urartu]